MYDVSTQPPVLQVFIPELGRAFHAAPGFRLFGAQNPVQEGGGRRGLPRSFLNRFTRVAIELLETGDLLYIAGRILMHPALAAAEAMGPRWEDGLRVAAEPLCSDRLE